jgi:hypothetical protein
MLLRQGRQTADKRWLRAVAICKTKQRLAYIENKSAGMESAMTFPQGVSGNPHGNRHRTRHLLNQEFMQALLLNFRHPRRRSRRSLVTSRPRTSRSLRFWCLAR